jgi:hypothetical protein
MGEEVMDEDKAGKATMIAAPYNIICPECQFVLSYQWEGKNLTALHGDYDNFPCSHSGKRFKMATVELEEI